MKALDLQFHIFQGKTVLVEKNIPIYLLVARVWHVEDTPNTILDHVITELILAGLDGDLQIYSLRNSIEFSRACII